jgi:hypothetical protein
MSVESWIDKVCKVWEISDGAGGTVRSYRLFERDEFPEALSEFPCCITYPLGVNMTYSMGGPCIDLWEGVTEFHILPSVDKANLATVLRYVNRIRAAAAANATLGGTVAHFVLAPENSIQGPVRLQYGDESEHHGLIVRWQVKEISAVTVANGA